MERHARKKTLTDFVAKVTQEGSPDFVPPAERIAVFDNDGTLWAEQPMYFQGACFLFGRVKTLALQHSEWKTPEPFASLLKGDMQGVATAGEKGALEMMAATHAGTTEEFSKTVSDWIATAKHPEFPREQVVGISSKLKFEMRDGQPVLVKLPPWI